MDIDIDDILYPKFNTRRLDSPDTVDGKPYVEGVNLLGPPIDQFRWNMIDGYNEYSHTIGPGERMKLGKAEQFYQAIYQYEEVFYGGAAGGGKSDTLMRSHVLKHLEWNARGIRDEISFMFCESKEEIKRRHLAKLWERVPTWFGEMDYEDLIFYVHPKFGNGQIMFLYVGKTEQENKRILSYESPYISVDESGQNSAPALQFIGSRLRSSKVPAEEWCLALASNPGGISHKYHSNRFINPHTRAENVYFIQALAEENPFLPKKYYTDVLGKLPEKIQEAYRNGNWNIYEGQYFDMLDESVHIVPQFDIPDEIPKYRGIDHGTSHPTGCTWFAHFPKSKSYPRGRVVVYRYYEKKDKYANNHKRNIFELSKKDVNLAEWVGLSHDAFSNKGSTTGDLTVAERYNAYDEFGSFNAVRAPRDRKQRWALLANLLSYKFHWEVKDGKRIRKIDEFPVLQFMDCPDVRVLFDELRNLIHKSNDPEDVERLGGNDYEVGFGDEGPDSLGYGLLTMGSSVFMPQSDEPEFEPKAFDPYRHAIEKYRGLSDGPSYARF